MPLKLMNSDEILLLLVAAPAKIQAATSLYVDDWLAQRPSLEEWSPNEILAHLRACQDVWGDTRVIRMLGEDVPTMRAVNPNTWLQETDYRELPFSVSLAAFTRQRARFMGRIGDMSIEQWGRMGTFTGGGRPRRYSIHTEADALARHERSHIKQLEKLCRAETSATT